jgi:UPF0755 protein
MKRSRSSALSCLLLTVVGLCLTGALGWITYNQLNQRVIRLFGPPAPNLSLVQRISLSASLLLQADQLTEPLNRFGDEREFQIEMGESISSIVGRLWEAQLIRDPSSLRMYLQYSGKDTRIQAGTYRLSSAMSAQEIALELLDATPERVNFHILPGWRIDEISVALPTSGLNVSQQDFMRYAITLPAGHPLTFQIPSQVTAEGLLHPGVYDLPREITAIELISQFMDRTALALTAELQEGFTRQGLTLYEAIILASIVEREAVVDEEKPLIASVFLNRLAIGMKLDSDPTAQYALGFVSERGGWWPSPLSLADLQVRSPYNTYLNTGLPPTPICNPDLNSLRAVAFPAQSPYYYFRAACDNSGRHVFAETFDQHLQNACP